MKQENSQTALQHENEITRRDALKKIGYSALTGSVLMVLLNTQTARASSTEPTVPGDTNGSGGSTVTWDDPS